MKKIAIIGASYLQNPLILKAEEMGLETHVFAWKSGEIGEQSADYFYPISITEKEQILAKCQEIGVQGVCTIASDLANITVAYVAAGMGLVANSPEAVFNSTDKNKMRKVFADQRDPSPISMIVDNTLNIGDFRFPIIIKPADRSGSRGITKLDSAIGFDEAVNKAREVSFSGIVLVEEFFQGYEFSVEYLSWKGKHHFLSVTEKFTSGTPMFIERGHLEPARISKRTEQRICSVVEHALDSLGVKFGASHSELKVNNKGEIAIIEIGSRMGGDRIGSDLVKLSTGYDFVEAVVQVAMGKEPEAPNIDKRTSAAIRYIFDDTDRNALTKLKDEHPEYLIEAQVDADEHHAIVDSSSRYGYFLMAAPDVSSLEAYLPTHDAEGL